MRSMETIALKVWEEEVTALKELVRAGTVTLDEAQRRRAVIDEACALFADGRPEEAGFGVGGCRMNTPVSGYFNRRFALGLHADWVASLAPQSRSAVPAFNRPWPEGRWWVSTSTTRPRPLPPDIEGWRRDRHLRCIHPRPLARSSPDECSR